MKIENKELIGLLQEYLRINTSHPVPDYDAAITLFEKQAKVDGFETQRINLSSGRTVLVILEHGANPMLPALALNHHMDVVLAPHPDQWEHPPFAGVQAGDMIYGRGAQDMKGVGVAHYVALQKLKKQGHKFERTVCLLLVPDEEIGGFTGVGELVKTQEFKKLNIGYVLDEGISSGDQKSLYIKVSERKPLQIKFIVQGTMGHGSRLFADNPIHKLINILEQFIFLHQGQQEKSSEIPTGLLLSANITSLAAGSLDALNVVPAEASATIDIRVPPGIQLSDIETMVNTMVQDVPGVSYTILASGCDFNYGDDYRNNFYLELEKAIASCDLIAQPYFAEEASDLRFYLREGIYGLGFTPFTIKENIHGIDEAVRISDLELGCQVLYNFLKSFCGVTHVGSNTHYL